MIKQLCLAFGVLAVSACGGGGGGGGGAVAAPENFSTSKFKSSDVGIVYSTSLAGNDSYGYNYTGTYAVARRSLEMLGGVQVTPTDTLFTINDGTTPLTFTVTTYSDASGNAVTTGSTGITCTQATSNALPDHVQIGDFGILSSSICSDGLTYSHAWRAEDGGTSRAKVVFSSLATDNFSQIVTSNEMAYTLDLSGNIVGFDYQYSEPSTPYSLHMWSI